MKTKYIIGTIIVGSLCLISALHPEKYSIVLPIIFLIATISSLYLGFTDKEFNINDSESKILLSLLISPKYNKYFNTGLCSFISELWGANIIDHDLLMRLRLFVSDNAPTLDIYELLDTKERIKCMYYFQSGDKAVRIEWLKLLINFPGLIKK